VKLESKLRVLPRTGLCEVCGNPHPRDTPHHKDSAFYRAKFFEEKGRYPDWNDALAHCTEQVRESWRMRLSEYGIDTQEEE